MTEKHGLRDDSPSLVQYFLGPYMYAVDLDSLNPNDGYSDGLFLFANNEAKTLAIVDYKHGNLDKLRFNFSMRVMQNHANESNKPLFVVIYYLEKCLWPVPMFLVIPANKLALQHIAAPGAWCSAEQFSMFQHKLRGLKWSPDAPIKKPSTPTEARLLKHITNGADGDLTCNDLSKVFKRYKSPDVSEVIDSLK